MAQQFLASIYAVQDPLGNYTYLSGTEGHLNSLPSVGTRCYPADAGTTANSVTMNAVIELLPTGLNIHGFKFWTPSTVTQINTAANA